MPHGEHTPESRSVDMSPAVRSYHEKLYRELMELVRTLGCERLADVEERYQPHISEGAMTIARDATLTKQFTRLDILTRHLEAIRRNPKELSRELREFIAEEFEKQEAELRALFHEGFLGFLEIEKTFVFEDGAPAIDFTEEEKSEAKQMLLGKLAEPDITHFIEHLKANPEEAKSWLLVYRPRAKMYSQLLVLSVPVQDISLMNIRDILNEDVCSRRANPVHLVFWKNISDEGWYRRDRAEGETRPWAEKPLTQGWQFVTKDVVAGTRSKTHAEQTSVLAGEAMKLGFTDDSWRRRAPQEVLYDSVVALMATGTRLLEQRYDRTDQQTSIGSFVNVGGFDASGMRICATSANDADDWFGACLSR